MSLLGYFEGLPRAALDELYRNGWACQGLLRALSPLARLYVLRLATISASDGGALPAELVDAWAKSTPQSRRKHTDALNELRRLSLLVQVEATGVPSVHLHRSFATQLSECLRVGGVLGNDTASSSDGTLKSAEAISLTQLEMRAHRAWEGMLQAILRPPRNDILLAMPCDGASVQELLLEADLLCSVPPRAFADDARGSDAEAEEEEEEARREAEGVSSRHKMTRDAHRFLLLPTHVQVWRLVRAYMDLTERGTKGRGTKGTRNGTLCFLMRLGLLQLGRGYRLDDPSLDAVQRAALADMTLLGLVYRPPENPQVYYATHLSQYLLSGTASATVAAAAAPTGVVAAATTHAPTSAGMGGGSGGGGTSSSAFVVLETNFRIYAYTSSVLWAQVLNIFSRLEYVLPNLIVGNITRESVHSAIDGGVSAADIKDFLERSAHPRMLTQTPVLPETVINQINLWAKDRHRLAVHEVVLYEHFASEEEFAATQQYARDNNVLVWARGAPEIHDCRLAVDASAREGMKRFIRARRSEQMPPQ
jgi:transcription initiation factor TFIIH subunit 4